MTGYLTTAPAGTDNLSSSYKDIQNNFSVSNSVYGVDHNNFATAGPNQGFHNIVHMVATGGTPTPASLVGELYCRQITSVNLDEALYYQGGGGRPVQLTVNVTPITSSPGYTFLPGNMLMQWGTNTCTSGTTITFPIAYKAATPPVSIQCTVFQNSTNRHFVYVRSSTNTGFVTTQLDSGGAAETNTFNWVTIGLVS